jgi:OmpA-OmpF porin, OOP family
VNIKSLLSTVGFGAAMLAASLAMAQAPAVDPLSPWYFGFGLTRSDGTPEQSSLTAVSGGAAVGDIDDRFGGFKAYLGYEINRYLAVEVGGGRLGTLNVAYANGQQLEYRMTTFYGDLVGFWPGSDKWALLARIGASIGETRIGLENSPISLTSDQRDETDVDIKYGVGAQYYFTPEVGGRIEYERYKMPDPIGDGTVKVDNIAASIFIRF